MNAWAIKNPDGNLVEGTIANSEGDAWFEMTDLNIHRADKLKELGWTAVEVSVTEKPAQPDISYKAALNQAAYALFQLKRMTNGKVFAAAEYAKACAVLNRDEQPESAEPVAWLIEGRTFKVVHLHDAIGDYRQLDPSATVTPLIPQPEEHSDG